MLASVATAGLLNAATVALDLSGQWNVRLDPRIVGINNRAVINLPGTTDLAGLGVPNTLTPELQKPQVLRLTRKNSYIGEAVYSREIDIPQAMANKPLKLSLERVLWKSRVVVDGDTIEGFQESLTTPHQFVIEKGLSEGNHNVEIIVDNTQQHDISVDLLAHAYTNDTQVMWNGVLGTMKLEEILPVELSNVQVYPNAKNGTVLVNSTIESRLNKSKKVKLSYSIDGKEVYSATDKVLPGKNTISHTFTLPDFVGLWDEFNPNIYSLEVSCDADGKRSTEIVPLGVRCLESDGKVLRLNGRPVFLRGTLECCIFPLTGNPPTTTQGWGKVMKTAQQWGLNHLRFHSWCPPEAAFRVADSLGMYLQVELPEWTLKVGSTPSDSAFIYQEFDRISTSYGNHPSLCLITSGNELQSDFNFLNGLTEYMRNRDPRHLYSATSFTFEKGHGGHAEPFDQFLVTQWTDDGWVRGQGVFDQQSPTFNQNYDSSMGCVTVPLITHEIGQYAVYPNLREIDKYTGTLEPLNFKAVRNDMERKGLLDQADAWTQASGKLAYILYKEEIERALKTSGLSGYQLLGLQDFPGQGTALVGLVDAFWDSKGIVSAEDFRQFNSPVVPLANFDKAVYCDGEPFKAQLMIANYSDDNLKGRDMVYTITDDQGNILYQGKSILPELKIGGNTVVGEFSTVLRSDKAQALTLNVFIPADDNDKEDRLASNQWDIWVYPLHSDLELEALAKEIVVTDDYNRALEALQKGGKVLFSPNYRQIKGLEGKFVPVFWSPVHFPKQAGTMGLLTNPENPALADFPTDMHTNWQWWDLMKNSTTMVIDSIPGATPIIGQIDSFINNRRLASLFEANCENGKIIFSGMDLLGNSSKKEAPERVQMLYTLLKYMNSEDFNPNGNVTQEQLRSLILEQDDDRSTKPESIYN